MPTLKDNVAHYKAVILNTSRARRSDLFDKLDADRSLTVPVLRSLLKQCHITSKKSDKRSDLVHLAVHHACDAKPRAVKAAPKRAAKKKAAPKPKKRSTTPKKKAPAKRKSNLKGGTTAINAAVKVLRKTKAPAQAVVTLQKLTAPAARRAYKLAFETKVLPKSKKAAITSAIARVRKR